MGSYGILSFLFGSVLSLVSVCTAGVEVKVDLYSSMFSALSSILSLIFRLKSTKVCFLSILSMDLRTVECS